jgi:uncharacterized protein YxjI
VGLAHVFTSKKEDCNVTTDYQQIHVSQKPKIVELTNQYKIMDPQGAVLGRVEQKGQGRIRRVMRFATDLDQFLTPRLTILDSSGVRVLSISRPAKIFKSRFEIEEGTGRRVGRIA